MSAQIDGAIYRFDACGCMVAGWACEGGQWFYHGASGAQVAGWANVNGTWYYLARRAR